MINCLNFCERMLEISKEKSRVASENADLKAFSEAEEDIKNYDSMRNYYSRSIEEAAAKSVDK
nr:MAG TPA: hypothetical protein [Caudoviricetes sp.]DAX34114.1 MAG TPA: hypothetical protein [Caudoviricetes sp.]